MPKKHGQFLTNTGVTLVELSIATAIFVIAVLPLFVLLNRTMKEVMFYNRTTVATKLGQDLMEEILNMPNWDEQGLPTPGPGKAIATAAATAPGALGPDAEVYPNFDDIDDYNNFADNPVAGSNTQYRRQVTVEYVNVPDAGTVTASPGARTNFKRVRVQVTWDHLDVNFAGRNPVEIIAIAANINKY